MGIRKSTGFLAVLVIALAVTSIGLLIALLLAKQESPSPGVETMTNGEAQKSDTPLGSPTVSKDWNGDTPTSVKSQVTEESNELSTVSQLPIDVDDEDKYQEEEVKNAENVSKLIFKF